MHFGCNGMLGCNKETSFIPTEWQSRYGCQYPPCSLSFSLSFFALSRSFLCVTVRLPGHIAALYLSFFIFFYLQLCNKTTRRELHADSVPPGKSDLASVRQSAFNCTYQYSVYFLLTFERGGFHGYAGMYEIAM